MYLLHELVRAVAHGEEVRVLWVPLDRRHVLALRLVRREGEGGGWGLRGEGCVVRDAGCGLRGSGFALSLKNFHSGNSLYYY
eukprot:scaffold44148_cov31-Phaeocystis_antarctica.AAC.1